MKKYQIWILLFVLLPGTGQARQLQKVFHKPDFVVKPYLQFATRHQISILWETSHRATAAVRYGEARFDAEQAMLDQRQEVERLAYRHEITLEGLKPETNYFYQVISVTQAGDTLQSGVLPFKTAVKKGTPFAFTVFGDSQNNPDVWGRVTHLALQERPNFGLHAGDLVGLGYLKQEWVNQFFSPSHDFMKQVPLFTILGNHEHDAAFYYQYFMNPEPEHYYSFTYGNAEFFLIDTNQYQEPGTPMYHWLEHALAASEATWKFVIQHHPPYSSEENDFGDTHYQRSLLGDEEAQLLLPLYEKYGVDIVFYGHIHMYERTWPILKGKAVEQGGVRYINVGGAGGDLEQPAPTRTWFMNKTKTAHHFAYVAINGQQLSFQAIDEEGRIFDQFKLSSSRTKKSSDELAPVTPYPKRARRVFTDTMQVQLQTVSSTDQIFYTLDGSEPNKTSRQFKQNVTLDKSTTLKARAYNEHGSSKIATFHYRKTGYLRGVERSGSWEKGLSYNYYPGTLEDEKKPLAGQLTLTSSGAVDSLKLSSLPHKERNWGAEFSGYMEIPESGYYSFQGHAFHIFRFYLHNQLRIEEYGREINQSAEVYLAKGLHPIRVAYHTYRYRPFMRFEYIDPSGERHPITDLNFYHDE